MTDTSAEAVERLAHSISRAEEINTNGFVAFIGQEALTAAATLRALVAERDAARADRDAHQRDAIKARAEAQRMREVLAAATSNGWWMWAPLAFRERVEAVLASKGDGA